MNFCRIYLVTYITFYCFQTGMIFFFISLIPKLSSKKGLISCYLKSELLPQICDLPVIHFFLTKINIKIILFPSKTGGYLVCSLLKFLGRFPANHKSGVLSNPITV